MIDLNPKNQFQKLREEDAKKFADVIVEPFMRTALTYAFAQFGHGGVTPEELSGAKKFLTVFAGLSEPVRNNQLPPKSLKTPDEIEREAATLTSEKK